MPRTSTFFWLMTGALCLLGVQPAPAQLALRGRLLLESDFQTATNYSKERVPVQEGWQVRAVHAKWVRTSQGVASVWETGHMPVLGLEGSFSNAIVEVEFRYRSEPGRWGGCRISASNPELNPRAYAVSVWANHDGKNRSTGLVLEHDEWSPGVVTAVGNSPAAFPPDTWHTLRLEFIGTNALATCNGSSVYGSHDKFGLSKQALYLGVGTCAHELRHLRVYEALPNPSWTPPGSVREAAPHQR
jgi:hypothetical protein